VQFKTASLGFKLNKIYVLLLPDDSVRPPKHEGGKTVCTCCVRARCWCCL